MPRKDPSSCMTYLDHPGQARMKKGVEYGVFMQEEMRPVYGMVDSMGR